MDLRWELADSHSVQGDIISTNVALNPLSKTQLTVSLGARFLVNISRILRLILLLFLVRI